MTSSHRIRARLVPPAAGPGCGRTRGRHPSRPCGRPARGRSHRPWPTAPWVTRCAGPGWATPFTPSLTDLPLGLWTATTVLDLLGGPGARPAAQRLVGLGLLAVPPTAASGWSEWHRSDRPAQRVGVAHVALNVAAIGLYAGSWLARRGDRHRVGAALALVGAGAAGAGGYLGGHLASVRKVSSAHPAFSPRGRPARESARVGRASRPCRDTHTHAPTPAAPVCARTTAASADPASAGRQRPHGCDRRPAHADRRPRRRGRVTRPVERREEALHALLSLLAAHEAVEEELIHPVLPALDERRDGARSALEEERGMAQQLGRLEELDIDSPTFRMQFGLFEEALSYHANAEEHEELPEVVARISAADAAFIVTRPGRDGDLGGDEHGHVRRDARAGAGHGAVADPRLSRSGEGNSAPLPRSGAGWRG